ncbi:hypothetical protein V499_03418 [Pseudogymnoascus sp. VKM F-103]|nr:hypothetical protein V499_03418 [Pseudogymnoascus sp. VKM F-103]
MTPQFAENQPLQILSIPKRIPLADRQTHGMRNILTPAPVGWGGHNRAVSMPSFAAGFSEPLPAGFFAPTRNTLRDEISSLIDAEFGPAPREDRIKDKTSPWDDGLAPPAAEKATSNVSMSGMTNTTSSTEQFRRALEQDYVPTSPSFSGLDLPAAEHPSREPSPMSIAHRSNSVDDGSNTAGPYEGTSVVDFADEEYDARDTESADNARDARFQDAYNRAISAAREACRLAKRTLNLDVAERRMDDLNRGLTDIINEEYESINELRLLIDA